MGCRQHSVWQYGGRRNINEHLYFYSAVVRAEVLQFGFYFLSSSFINFTRQRFWAEGILIRHIAKP
jgi:hypothetical protein